MAERVTEAEFAAVMARLGPFEPEPRLAVALSGGADSTALLLLATAWACDRGGRVAALIVDHGLRPEAAAEASAAAAAASTLGAVPSILRLTELAPGPGLAHRARDARYAALSDACAACGIVHLLLGHHAADQAETVLVRSLGQSGPEGMAGMAALVERDGTRILRPLLGVAPGRLRATLRAAGFGWSEDPSNADAAMLRPRLRAMRRDAGGTGPATRALVEAARVQGQARARREQARAASLAAAGVSLRPEGFAHLPGAALAPPALAALIRAVSGARYPPDAEAVERLAASLRPATLAGVELRPAGRFGPGFLLLREAAAMAGPVAAVPGAVWDGRFRLAWSAAGTHGMTIGAVGAAAAGLRRLSALPAAVLRTLPGLWAAERLVAVPAIGYPDSRQWPVSMLCFSPPEPVAGAPFLP